MTALGTHHTNDPQDPQFKPVIDAWNRFITAIPSKKNISVVIENPSGRACRHYQTSEEAIEHDCDRGLATYFAQQHHATLIGAELPTESVIAQLFNEFDHDLVLYFCFAQALLYWHDFNKHETSQKDFVMNYVHQWTKQTHITFEDLVALHKKLTGKSFRSHSVFFKNIMNLEHHNSFLKSLFSIFSKPIKRFKKDFHTLLKRSHQIRDQHIFNVIKAEWNKGNHVFIVYGAFHTIALESALQELAQQ